jgi:hypothetical protein
MSDAPISISPDVVVAQPPPQRKRVLLKWSLLATGLFFAFLMWQCGSGLVKGGRASDVAVVEFHRTINSGQFDQIYDKADHAFQDSDTREEMSKFFNAIHSKLGNAGPADRGGININSTTGGTFLTVNYTTHYERGTAAETFVWRKGIAGDLTLVRYNIQSKALIVQ